MRYTHLCVVLIPFHSCTILSCICYICSSVALASFLCPTHSCIALSLYRAHSCNTFIHASHLFMYRTHSCVTSVHASHSSILAHLLILRTHLIHHTRSTIHLFMRCIHSRIAPSKRYVASLLSCISHAACSPLTPFELALEGTRNHPRPNKN